MAISIGPLPIAPAEYSAGRETQFRRDLQAYLESIVNELKSVNSGSSPQGSLASKRENLLAVAIGVTEYS